MRLCPSTPHTPGSHPIQPQWCLIKPTLTQGRSLTLQITDEWRIDEGLSPWNLPVLYLAALAFFFFPCLFRFKLECISWSGLLKSKSLSTLRSFYHLSFSVIENFALLVQTGILTWKFENRSKGSGFNRYAFEQTLGDSEGLGSLVCCSPWGHKELDTTWLPNNN